MIRLGRGFSILFMLAVVGQVAVLAYLQRPKNVGLDFYQEHCGKLASEYDAEAAQRDEYAVKMQRIGKRDVANRLRGQARTLRETAKVLMLKAEGKWVRLLDLERDSWQNTIEDLLETKDYIDAQLARHAQDNNLP